MGESKAFENLLEKLRIDVTNLDCIVLYSKDGEHDPAIKEALDSFPKAYVDYEEMPVFFLKFGVTAVLRIVPKKGYKGRTQIFGIPPNLSNIRDVLGLKEPSYQN